MRQLLRLVIATVFFIGIRAVAHPQTCIPTGINHAIINRSCTQLCADINLQIPDIRTTDNYIFGTIAYNPYPYTVPTSNEITEIYVDDNYSNIITLPFNFCFYGTTYNQCVVGSNGLITFDLANAAPCGNSYMQTFPIPYISSNICSSSSAYYPQASIMGVFTDLFPVAAASPPDKKIAWHIEGTAPCRKFVLNYYHVGMFGNGNYATTGTCNNLNPTTFQIVLYESTDLIEVYIERKLCNASGSGVNTIMGIQDWTRTRFVAAPGKNATVWTESNTAYRFTPSGIATRHVSTEILTMTDVALATAGTSFTTPGLIDLNFPNICVAGASTDFKIRTTYQSCENPAVQVVNIDTITVNLTGLTTAAAGNNTSCNGANDGSITATASGGTGPYTWTINGGPGIVGPSPYTFTNLAPGSYTISYTDATGCLSTSVTIPINAGPSMTTTSTKTDALCNGTATGTITVTQPAMAVPPYEYSLDGITWQSSNVFTGLLAGNYTVYYRSINGCQGSHPETIGEPAALAASHSTIPVVCNGQSNGTITITANGGVSPYQYSIDGGATWQASNIFNVAAGSYTITIRDANGCITTRNPIVTEPTALSASSVNTAASCDGGNDGTITVMANGGNSGYQYSIDGVTFQASNVFNVGPGSYTVTVRDALWCTTSFPAPVVLGSNFVMTPQTDATICEGTSVQLQLVSNATVYSWTPATGLSNTNIPNPVANPTTTTDYYVTATLGRCSAIDTVTVNVNPAPIPNAGPDGYICYGQTFQLQGSGGVQFTWTPSTYLSSTSVPNPVSTPTRTISYTLSEVVDALGCRSLITDEMTVDVTPPIKVNTFPYDTVGYPGDQFMILAVPSQPNIINYSWTPSVGLSDATIPNPLVTIGAIGDDVIYQVTTSTLAGCKGEGYVRVRVYKGPDVYVPTGFTPNGDGKNDKFTPFPVGIKEMKYFRVFNRWGQLLFSTNKLHDGWDGRFGGRDQPTGVYVWMAEVITNENKVISRKGTVTIIR